MKRPPHLHLVHSSPSRSIAHPDCRDSAGPPAYFLAELRPDTPVSGWLPLSVYLQSADTFYMEERMLQGMVIGCLKIKDVEEYLSLVSGFVPLINSWSVCDTFDFAGKQRFVDRNKERVWQFLEGWMQSDKEYEIRFGVVMAMAHYIDADYIQNVLQWMNRIDHEGYYVKMAVAWALSVCYVKFPKETMLLLKENRLDDFTYNKALQKITESFRVSPEDKDIIRDMKRKVVK